MLRTPVTQTHGNENAFPKSGSQEANAFPGPSSDTDKQWHLVKKTYMGKVLHRFLVMEDFKITTAPQTALLHTDPLLGLANLLLLMRVVCNKHGWAPQLLVCLRPRTQPTWFHLCVTCVSFFILPCSYSGFQDPATLTVTQLFFQKHFHSFSAPSMYLWIRLRFQYSVLSKDSSTKNNIEIMIVFLTLSGQAICLE